MTEDHADEKSPPTQRKTSFKPVLFTAIAVFVVALGVFSWSLGVFTQHSAPKMAEHLESVTAESEEAIKAEASNSTSKMELPAEDALPAIRPEVPVKPGTSGLADSMKAASWPARDKFDLQQQQLELDAAKRELTLLKHDIEKLLEQVQEAKTERIVKMAKLYDTMESEAVAKQLSSMDDRTVVMLLPQMNTRTAAKAMALLEPKRAAQITTKLLALDQ